MLMVKPLISPMTDNLKIALAQLNLTVGDIAGNCRKVLAARDKAAGQGADLVVYSELCITGYPPEDLVLKTSFRKAAMEAVYNLAKATSDNRTAMLVSAPWEEGGKIYNAAFLLADGGIQHKQFKYDLPNYGVFDEKRVFDTGELPEPFKFRGIRLGLMVCEDMWSDDVPSAMKKADILISVNASPFEVGKHKKRLERAKAAAKVTGKPVIYLNQICGQDDLVFDGDSFILPPQDFDNALDVHDGLSVRLSRTQEVLEITDWRKRHSGWACAEGTREIYDSEEQVIYQAMVLALRDYAEKNGFPGVLIGMSGGIDSALTAAVAVDALGAERVRLVMMPSRYTSAESVRDAEECAQKLGVRLDNIPIEDMFEAYENMLAPLFTGLQPDTTEENLQSRIRGALLMALSNKFGHMVMATGNKSEMATGYATLYGDMCGGYSVLKDVYKTQVFTLARWRNKYMPENSAAGGLDGEIIPQNIISKPPTAELRPNQTDQDSLPPYEILDDILIKIIEQRMQAEDIIKSGHNAAVVERIRKMLYAAEYKRRQSCPGAKISARPFGRDRRYPITNRFF